MNGPTPSKVAHIVHLCDSWAGAAQLPGGGIGIGGSSEQFRLLRNGIAFHALEYDELRAACLGLGRVLLLPGLNAIIDLDHIFLWSWCAEVVLSTASPVFSGAEWELAQLCGACARAALAKARPAVASNAEWELHREQNKVIPFHMRQMAANAHLILAYLSFPLLEGVAKKTCRAYVEYDGTVRQPFSAPRAFGKPRQYPTGAKCNSLRDLLHLLHRQVASPSLAAALDDFRRHVEQRSADAFEKLD